MYYEKTFLKHSVIITVEACIAMTFYYYVRTLEYHGIRILGYLLQEPGKLTF